ncbi:MAG: ChaN family lipoprotein [Acidobacteriota bacterium]
MAIALVAGFQTQTDPPRRVIDGQTGEARPWAAMIDELAQADVVFVGEQHDDPNTHKLELAILKELAAKGRPVTLAMEMFERDVQGPVTNFGAGKLAEPEFLKFSRPWPRYASDYKPLVDFANSQKLPVVASNVPRPFASEVSKAGFAALEPKTAAERKWFAADLQCPTGGDEYYLKFLEAMGTHPDASADRFYFAQCVKDETMGESIADSYAAGSIGGKRPLIVHVNGAFHSDFHYGTVSRVQRRLPGKRIAVVTVVPVDNIETETPDAEDRRRGDYLVYTPAPPKVKK